MKVICNKCAEMNDDWHGEVYSFGSLVQEGYTLYRCPKCREKDRMKPTEPGLYWFLVAGDHLWAPVEVRDFGGGRLEVAFIGSEIWDNIDRVDKWGDWGDEIARPTSA